MISCDNRSEYVGQYTDDGTEAYDAFILNYGSIINLNTHNKLKFKLYSSSSIQVLAKLEGGSAIEKWSDFMLLTHGKNFLMILATQLITKTLHLFCFLMPVKIMVIQMIFIILMNLMGRKLEIERLRNNEKKSKALIVFLTLCHCLCLSANNSYNSEKDIYRKVDSIMNLMTLDEKIGQTIMYSGDWNKTGPYVTSDNMKFLKEGNLGSMLNVYTSKGTKELQKIAVEETRLGIPLLFGYDVIHGFKTIFPINLGIASSWDMKDIEEVVRISAEEASASGVHWTFAPMIDIARDPRWGANF